MSTTHASSSQKPFRQNRHSDSSQQGGPTKRRRPNVDAAEQRFERRERPRYATEERGNYRQRHVNRTQSESSTRQGGARALSLANTPVSLDNLPDLTGITKLDLSNCKLTKLDFVRQASATLTWLNVSGNNLSAPDAWQGVQELQNLSVLNASNCSLKSVPSCVAKLKSLKAFVATHNSFRKLSHLVHLPELNTIVVSHNSLESLPQDLATLPQLKKISASHNRLVSTSLPDLSGLSHLREIKFNDNPTLDDLPSHFSSWGKHESPSDSADTSKHDGLEIVDLGSCGFEDWSSLRQLAAHSAIYNLVLKGNKVITEALDQAEFDELKDKMLILLPNLRVLDGHRFDAKFRDLKARRDARAPEEKVLDAGPMGLALNAARDDPVAISQEALAKRMTAKRDRLIEKRLEQGLEVRKDWLREYQQRNGLTKASHDDDASKDELASESNKRKETGSSTENGFEEPKKKKKKNRHEARRQVDAQSEVETATADDLVRDEAGELTSLDPEAAPGEPQETKKGKTTAEAVASQPPQDEAVHATADATATPTQPKSSDKPKKNRRKKSKEPLLAELLGADEEPKQDDAQQKKSTGSKTHADAEDEPDTKEKTSVLKVVEVKKKDGKKGKGKKGKDSAIDVNALLGLESAKPDANVAEASNSGVVGLGWD
ncbi:hypothetical protein OIO90_006594 [Microbotryomycetes sp. JL221]|nr:hypothetical protein OIO90_006594 [Microbotryomycetes sp. JL221]